MSLIGNPVKIGNGPAAVTSPFSLFEKGTSLTVVSHCYLMGRPLKKGGKSEYLPE